MDDYLHRATAAHAARNLSEQNARWIFEIAGALPKDILPSNRVFQEAARGTQILNSRLKKVRGWRNALRVVLEELAVFPDLARRHSEWAATADAHFQNFDIGTATDSLGTAGASTDGALLSSIPSYRAIVADTNALMEDRAFALAMLIHLLAALLTPGHLMSRVQKGGSFDGGLNHFPLRIEGVAATQFHALFDGFALMVTYGFRPGPGHIGDYPKLVETNISAVQNWLSNGFPERTLLGLAKHSFSTGLQLLNGYKLKEGDVVTESFVAEIVSPQIISCATMASVVINDVLSAVAADSEVWPAGC